MPMLICLGILALFKGWLSADLMSRTPTAMTAAATSPARRRLLTGIESVSSRPVRKIALMGVLLAIVLGAVERHSGGVCR